MSEGGTEASVTIDEQRSAPVVQVGAQRPGKQRHGRGGDGGEHEEEKEEKSFRRCP